MDSLQLSFNRLKSNLTVFRFKRQGYDPLIDYLKGLCILFVILNHCMPVSIMDKTAFFFWGVSAVPIFLIIQVFHAYKRGVNFASPNFKKIWKRIVLPYLITEIIILFAFIMKEHHFTIDSIINDTYRLIKSGGYGPGAYYPLIYIQFAIILPIVAHVFKAHHSYLCLIFIITSQLIETSCSYFQLPQLAYRILFLRYFFLFYLGYILSYKGFALNIYTLGIASICLIFSTYIAYSNQDFSPLLYDFVNPLCHWFCYIFIAFILLFILRQMYNYFSPKSIIRKYILNLGKYSYEIFLFQLAYFAIIDDSIHLILSNSISYYPIYILCKITIPTVICTFPIIIYKEKKIIWKQNGLI